MSVGDKIVMGCSNVEQLTTSMDILQNKMDCDFDSSYHCDFDNLYKEIAEFTPNYWY
jgi:hypothetical protein